MYAWKQKEFPLLLHLSVCSSTANDQIGRPNLFQKNYQTITPILASIYPIRYRNLQTLLIIVQSLCLKLNIEDIEVYSLISAASDSLY